MPLNLKPLNLLRDFKLNNPILAKAIHQANGMISNRNRMIVLLSRMIKKIHSLDNKPNVSEEAKKKLFVLVRLLKAFAKGHYRSISWKATISILGAILYFVNPADIIPDFIPLTGLLDDFSILIWTYNSLQGELDKFHEWENANLTS